jgi:decaprenyl-phosphate phosphoribosyltransferase
MSRAQADPRAVTAAGYTPRPQSPPLGRPSVVDGAGTLLRAARPRQWLKNVLVFAAPTASGAIVHSGPLARTIAAFWIFVAASACTYLVNDVIDRESDRLHPVKRMRPVASGQLQPRLAVSAAIVLGAASVAAAAVLGAALAAIVIAYLAISLAYSLRLKRVPLIELACVGSGFTLRAVAGGAAAHVTISPWFLVMTSFGALFIVAGKRTSEQAVLGDEQASHRVALADYPAGFLRGVRVLAMSVTVTTYCLWAFERAAGLRPADLAEDMIWFELSIIPFVLAVLAVELAISRGRGGEPEQLALSDHLLQFLGVAWVVLLVCGIYA